MENTKSSLQHANKPFFTSLFLFYVTNEQGYSSLRLFSIDSLRWPIPNSILQQRRSAAGVVICSQASYTLFQIHGKI